MIKRASGDWTRRLPPWATVRNCDLRRYRGPYRDISEEMEQKKRAISLLSAAFKRARATGAEVLVFRVGDGSRGRDTFRALMRDFICRDHVGVADLAGSRMYPDRIVVLLKSASRRSNKSV